MARTGALPGGARGTLALAAGVAVLAALPYLVGGVGRTFIPFDDNRYIYENPQVLRGLSGRTALWALTSTEHANWYPLRRLSHLADVSLFGLDARAHHLVSLAWHVAAALVLFLALRSLTGRPWRCFTATALFAAHPLQVESVAWAAERSNVQAGFFFALTLLLLARHAGRPGPGRYAALLSGAALSVMAKPTLVTLPLLLLLLDFWPLARLSPPGAPPWAISAPLLGRRLLEKAPFLLLAAGSAAMAVLAHRQSGVLQSLESLPAEFRVANAALSYWRYLAKLLWPADLAVLYPHPRTAIHLGTAWVGALLLLSLTALALLVARRRPWLAAGWLWYLGMLVPTIGFVQFGVHAMADRFAYLPSVGILLVLVWSAAEGLPAPRLRAAALAPVAGVTLAALCLGSAVQAGYWRDGETLFRHTLAATGGNPMISNNLGAVLAARGRHAEAADHYRAAIRSDPAYVEARYNLAYSLVALGRAQEAVEHYREVLRLRPDLPEAWQNLGLTLAALGRLEEAAASFRAVLRLRPDYAAARTALARVLERGAVPGGGREAGRDAPTGGPAR